MLVRVMPDCATHNGESLRQIHSAFTVFDPSFKYAEIEWIFKYVYSRGGNLINPVMDGGMSDDRFIKGCQFASDPELPIEEVNTPPLLYIMYCDHHIAAENGAGAGFTLLVTVHRTCDRFRFNISLVVDVVKKSFQTTQNVATIIKYDDPWLSHTCSFYAFDRQSASVTNILTIACIAIPCNTLLLHTFTRFITVLSHKGTLLFFYVTMLLIIIMNQG